MGTRRKGMEGRTLRSSVCSRGALCLRGRRTLGKLRLARYDTACLVGCGEHCGPLFLASTGVSCVLLLVFAVACAIHSTAEWRDTPASEIHCERTAAEEPTFGTIDRRQLHEISESVSMADPVSTRPITDQLTRKRAPPMGLERMSER